MTIIRAAIVKDIPFIILVENACFKETDKFRRHQFLHLITKGKGYFLVSVLSEYFVTGYVYGTNKGRIYSLAVDPMFRRENIGSDLLLAIESRFTPLKHSRLEVRADNHSVINFYKKHGYKQCGIKHNYYTDGTEAILMHKELLNGQVGVVETSDTLR